MFRPCFQQSALLTDSILEFYLRSNAGERRALFESSRTTNNSGKASELGKRNRFKRWLHFFEIQFLNQRIELGFGLLAAIRERVGCSFKFDKQFGETG